MTESKQPRVNEGVNPRLMFFRLLKKWIDNAHIEAPAYGGSTQRERDNWMRSFWHQEPHLAGVLNSVVALDKNRGWKLIGGRNQVSTYSQILRNADPPKDGFDDKGVPVDGKGWRYFFSQQSLAFYTSDVGALCEIGRDIPDGPLRALWSVDPTRCELMSSGLKFYPASGKSQEWPGSDFMRAVSMPSTDETLNGLGFCATSRILEMATIMIAVYHHDKEKLFAKVPKGLLMMQGITETMWQDAMEAQSAQLTAKEREFYAGLSIFFGDDIDAKLLALSQLPDGFDIKILSDLLMYTYALNFGYDPSEFWPVQFGSLGRGTEAEVQALKATGKGGLDFILAFQDNLQRELPPTLHFEFEQRNEKGEILEAEVAKAWAETINEMAKPSGPNEPATLSISEKRQLLAQKGLIPEDWTLEEEETVATDTESEKRYLENSRVLRAMNEFPNDEIVLLAYNPKTSSTFGVASVRRFLQLRHLRRE